MYATYIPSELGQLTSMALLLVGVLFVQECAVRYTFWRTWIS